MIAAIVIAMAIMLFAMEPVSGFIERHPEPQDPGPGLPDPDRRDAGGRRPGPAHAQGLHLLRDGVLARRGAAEHALSPPHPPPVGHAPLRARATGAVRAGRAALAHRGVLHGAARRRSRAALPADGHPGQGRERDPPAPGLQRSAGRAVQPLHGGAPCTATSASRSATGATRFGLVLERLPATLLLAGSAIVLTADRRDPARRHLRGAPRHAGGSRRHDWPPCSARPRPASGSG